MFGVRAHVRRRAGACAVARWGKRGTKGREALGILLRQPNQRMILRKRRRQTGQNGRREPRRSGQTRASPLESAPQCRIGGRRRHR